MNTMRKPRILLCLMLLALLASLLPCASAESFKAVVSVDSMKVYSQKSPYPCLGSLPRGTEVTVKGYNGSVALISYGGKTGIAQVSDMTRSGQASSDAQTASGTAMTTLRKTRLYKKASTDSSYTTLSAGTAVEVLAVNGKCAKVSYGGKVGYMVYSHLGEKGGDGASDDAGTESEPVKTGNAPVAASQNSRVYATAAMSGDSVAIRKGTKMTLLAVRGDCAMVEKGGAIGYMPVSDLEKASSDKQTPSTKSNPFASDTNEHAIYAFLIGEMGYNRAAAMGVMANIKYESGYRPTCDGDRGTSYGICQWHAGRKTNLINYCAENGLDHTTLEGQLRFFKYEITTRYSSIHAYLKGVENTDEGAYDAGYYFCFNYEAPAARTSQSTKRATYARDTLFGMK